MRAKSEPTISSSKSKASDLIVLVESGIKHKILHKKTLENASWNSSFLKKMRQENDCFAIRYICYIYRGIDSE